MSAEIIFSMTSFALSLIGLIPVFCLREEKQKQNKMLVLALIFSTLFFTTGFVLFKDFQHEKLIRTVQFEIHESLGAKSKTLTQLRRDLLAQRGYSDVVEALSRGLDEHVLDEDEIEFIRDGKSIPVKVYFVKH